MAITDLLIQDGVTGYNAEANISWQSSIKHLINLDISSGNPDENVLTALRNVTIKFDSYDKYCVQETLTIINTSSLHLNTVSWTIQRVTLS